MTSEPYFSHWCLNEVTVEVNVTHSSGTAQPQQWEKAKPADGDRYAISAPFMDVEVWLQSCLSVGSWQSFSQRWYMFTDKLWTQNSSVFLQLLFALEISLALISEAVTSGLDFAHVQSACGNVSRWVRGSSSLTEIMQEARVFHSPSSSSNLNPFEHVPLVLPLTCTG